MRKYFTDENIKFIMALAISMAISSLLLSIKWFTWQAWIFVSLMLLWKFYLVNAEVHNTAGLWRHLFIRIDEIKQQNQNKPKRTNTQMSTKTTRKRTNKTKKEKE